MAWRARGSGGAGAAGRQGTGEAGQDNSKQGRGGAGRSQLKCAVRESIWDLFAGHCNLLAKIDVCFSI